MNSRAYTAEEARDKFIDIVREYARYWARQPGKEPLEMCEGLAFSILNIFDGTSTAFPAVDLALAPHPDDKEYLQRQGENWYEPGQVFNDCQLHELFYKRETVTPSP